MRKKMALMSVVDASMYLREVVYIPPHRIRLLAREGNCTFCIALKNPSGSYSYSIRLDKLEQFKRGDIDLMVNKETSK